jgi:hypothetical protein
VESILQLFMNSKKRKEPTPQDPSLAALELENKKLSLEMQNKRLRDMILFFFATGPKRPPFGDRIPTIAIHLVHIDTLTVVIATFSPSPR